MVQMGDVTKLGDSVVLAYPFYQTKRINRTMTDASGDVAYTGIGFTPRMIHFSGVLSSASSLNDRRSIGATSVVGAAQNDQTIVATENNIYVATGQSCIRSHEGSSIGQSAFVLTFDTDGFTLNWLKQGSPTGNLAVMCMIFG